MLPRNQTAMEMMTVLASQEAVVRQAEAMDRLIATALRPDILGGKWTVEGDTGPLVIVTRAWLEHLLEYARAAKRA